MKIIKYIVSIIIFFSIIFILESLLQMTALPVTVFDLTFTPGSIIIIYFIFQLMLENKDEKFSYAVNNPSSIVKLAGALFTFIAVITLGIWCLWEGSHHPLQFYSGVKGSGHGYTLAIVGLLTSLMGLIGGWFCSKLIYKKIF